MTTPPGPAVAHDAPSGTELCIAEGAAPWHVPAALPERHSPSAGGRRAAPAALGVWRPGIGRVEGCAVSQRFLRRADVSALSALERVALALQPLTHAPARHFVPQLLLITPLLARLHGKADPTRRS